MISRTILVSMLLFAGSATSSAETFRWATFNCSLNRNQAGRLIADLESGNQQARQVAAIIQKVRPDVLLLNEFDWDAEGKAAAIFCEQYLATGQLGEQPIQYAYRYAAPVNTGVLAQVDLDGDGTIEVPQDAFGYGRFPGQYGMLVLSRYPIDLANVRTFQQFRWVDLPEAELPTDPASGQAYYSADAQAILRLSSKSHWDVPIQLGGQFVHLLASHPTPPVFDGPEDRNGRRNQDEIRFWLEYLGTDPQRAATLVDDAQQRGGLPAGAHFVIAGDLNSDPHDGDSRHQTIRDLLQHPRVRAEPVPASEGGVEQAARQAGANVNQQGDAAHDTADFNDRPQGSGNLRVDYVLPSATLDVVDARVFWPTEAAAEFAWVSCSDHRLVWIDIRFP